MHSRSSWLFATLLVVVASGATPQETGAQERRRSAPPSDGGRASLNGSPVNARFPFAGAWNGTRTMLGQSPDSGVVVPIVMSFQVVDSARNGYAGETIAGPRQGPGSPHLKSTADRRTIHWEERNSGPGYFVYTAQLVTSDSMTGTVKLRDGVLPGPPYGTFGLSRQSSGKR